MATITGTAGNDTLFGTSADDLLIGLEGDDILDGGGGLDTLAGGLGDDTYIDRGTNFTNELFGEGVDTLKTPYFSRALGAFPNVENLTYTGAGDFTGEGNNLDNRLAGGPGYNILDGLSGIDTAVLDYSHEMLPVIATLSATYVGGVQRATLTNIEALDIIGGPGADTLISGNQGANVLSGGGGNDVLWFYGATTLLGGAGFDHAIQLNAAGQTRSIGTSGLEVYVANNGNDVITTAGATTSTITYGGAGDDALTLGDAGGYLFGQDGEDILTGGSGRDILIGGDGRDTISGGAGDDIVYFDAEENAYVNGGSGLDYAIVNSPAGASLTGDSDFEVFVGNIGDDQVHMQGGADPVALYGYDGNDYLFGSNGASQLFGQNGNDTLNGSDSADVIVGGAGNDWIESRRGEDLLLGEEGDDFLAGREGNDTMWGGAGNDKFWIEVRSGDYEVIADFGDTAGNNDFLNFDGLISSSTTFVDQFGGVLITIPTFVPPTFTPVTTRVFVIGATAASIQDDMLFGLT